MRRLGLVVAAGCLLLGACKKAEAPEGARSAPEAGTPSVLPPAPPKPAGSARIRGRVRWVGTPPERAARPRSADPACAGMAATDEALLVREGRLANVLVRVKGSVARAPPAPSTPIVIDQKDCTFHPRVQGAVAGQSVMLKNADGTLHNVRLVQDKGFVFNVAQRPKGPPVDRPLPGSDEVLRLKCDIHPWMTAFVVMNPTGYFATTGEDGRFELAELPAGTFTLEAWHEKLGTQTTEVTVEEGAEATAEFQFQAL